MAWLGTWAQRWRLKVPGAQALEASAGFPVLLPINGSTGLTGIDLTPIFDAIGNNSLKIAITDDDGITQFYVEIADWDATAETAHVFFKHTGLSAGVDNEIFLYFDPAQPDNTTFVGTVGSTAGRQVWTGNNFAGVWHLGETSGPYLDSGPNGLDSTSVNVLTRTHPGDCGRYAPEFSTSSHRIDFGTQGPLGILGDLTLEAVAVIDAVDSSWRFLAEYYGGNGNIDNWYELGKTNSSSPRTMHWRWRACTTGCPRRMDSIDQYTVGAWTYFAGVRDSGLNVARLHIEDMEDSATLGGNPDGGTGPFTIGNNHLSENWKGPVDEVRVSNVARTEEWMAQTYYACIDQFVEFDGAPEDRGYGNIVNTVTPETLGEINTTPTGIIGKVNTV